MRLRPVWAALLREGPGGTHTVLVSQPRFEAQRVTDVVVSRWGGGLCGGAAPGRGASPRRTAEAGSAASDTTGAEGGAGEELDRRSVADATCWRWPRQRFRRAPLSSARSRSPPRRRVHRGGAAHRTTQRRRDLRRHRQGGDEEERRFRRRRVVKRVTGISLQDDKYVFVRGLGERYSNTALNGSKIPSTEFEKKVVPFDLFPAGCSTRSRSPSRTRRTNRATSPPVLSRWRLSTSRSSRPPRWASSAPIRRPRGKTSAATAAGSVSVGVAASPPPTSPRSR